MREIKFRAWDKRTKKMRQVIDIVFNAGMFLEPNDNTVKLIWVKGYDIIENKDIMMQREDKFELMQFTGLKDKNGKEIYEGDILLAPAYFGNLKCVCIYQQENGVSPIQGFGLYSYNSYFQAYRNLVESDEWDDFEVIRKCF